MQSLTFHQLLDLACRMSHEAPTTPLTVERAHQAMRDHVECRATRCDRKGAALQVLIDEGQLVTATDKPW